MEFAYLDGSEDGEHNGASFVEISKMFATQDTIYSEVHFRAEFVCIPE